MSPVNNPKLVKLFLGIVLAALTIFAFNKILDNAFILYDDPGYVTENEHVLQGIAPDSIAWAFKTTLTGNWIPLTWLTHMLDVELYGINPAGHHLGNLVIHTLNVLLVFALLQWTTRNTWAAALAAILFAVHPLRVESVAWVSERKDVLSGFFGLAACLSYVYYAKSTIPMKRIAGYCLTVMLLILGLMAKAMLVTWPFVFLLLDVWPLQRFERMPGADQRPTFSRRHAVWLLIEKIPFILIALIFCFVAFFAQAQQGAVQSLQSSPVHLRLLNVIVSYGRYLLKFIWPHDLALLYPLNLELLSFRNFAISAAVLACISAVCIWGHKKRPYLLVGWLWFLGTLVPVIGLVQIGSQSIADRYTYLPSIGLCVMAAFSINELWRRVTYSRIAGPVLLAVLVGAMIFLTQIQTAYWKDSLTLFGHTLKVTENNYTMQMNYAYAFLKAGKYDDAVREYLKAAHLRPALSEPYQKLGQVYIAKGNYSQAIRFLELALQKNNRVDLQAVYNNLGISYAKQSQYDKALDYFQKALQIEPDNSQTWSNAASAYRDSRQYTKAVEAMQHAVSIDPHLADYLNKLADILLIEGAKTYNPNEALHYAENACVLSGFQNPNWIATLAQACLQTGDSRRAQSLARQALRQLPADSSPSLRKRLQSLLEAGDD